VTEVNYTQAFPKDSQKYQYAYVHYAHIGGLLKFVLSNILQNRVFQVIDEDTGMSIYISQKFTNYYDFKGNSEYRRVLNMMIQEGWEGDGTVYNSMLNGYLPRYRRERKTI